jgi:hypothetical protein
MDDQQSVPTRSWRDYASKLGKPTYKLSEYIRPADVADKLAEIESDEQFKSRIDVQYAHISQSINRNK